MNDRRRGLGRGLGSLIPTAPEGAIPGSPSAAAGAATANPVPTRRLPLGEVYRPDADEFHVEQSPAPAEPPMVAGAYFAELPLSAIVPNPRQPRDYFDEDDLRDLGTSIKEVGLLQPIVVRKVDDEHYELIMGERRFRASKAIGLTEIPAIVRQTEDNRMLLDALLENLQRAQLNPLEEAAAFDQLLKDFECTHEELGGRVGRSRSYISNSLRLLKMSPEVQLKIAAGTISAGHAKALAGVDDHEAQEQLAKRIVQELLSVRAVEEIVQLHDPEKSKKPRKPRPGSRISPAVTDLADRLSDRYDTRVSVNVLGGRGKVVVEFGSLEDLDRILELMAPGERVRASE
ncbi:ParB/RepB/Spo0J family partition protein [Actinospica sp. MGRD01-02]|uniref:ParB/RepB/Spo0J family partition protein n=1 Tax=Actinospica acidithermotolerans TaxID=2828514 RepID=A0A941E6P9_9ACTN|nr:ParB/RepB/Spo0J family partition protein [Actinospica acidithermotolerans]MBR7824797.1 ParB/RepB/Spo0J family partition protein [Actinospica acidithermotolerans]